MFDRVFRYDCLCLQIFMSLVSRVLPFFLPLSFTFQLVPPVNAQTSEHEEVVSVGRGSVQIARVFHVMLR